MCDCNNILINLNDMVEMLNLPKKHMNKLKNKYPNIYNDDEVFQVEFEYLENDRECYNTIEFKWNTKHIVFKNTMELNTSSPFALWLCHIIPECECNN